MLSICKALPKPLFHKHLDGGRAASILFILAFLISLLTPLNTARSADIIWVPVYTEDFSKDIFSSGDWIRSDASVSVDTVNGWLHISGGYIQLNDYAEKTVSFSLPIRVDTRMKISGGFNNDYRLPDFGLYYGPADSEAVYVGYLPGQQWGWNFNGWTYVHTMGPEDINVWRTVEEVIRVSGGELLAKADTDTAFTSIVSKSWSISDEIIKIRFHQPWDATCELDYVSVSICDTVPYSYSLISPDNVDSVNTSIGHKMVTFNWQTSFDPDPNDTVHYDLYLSRSAVFHPDSTDSVVGLSDTTYRDSTHFTDANDLKLWYWKVKAYDKWGAVRWSDQSWSFYVYLCGDCNGDGLITVADVVYLINYLFKGGPPPIPLKAGDVNCDGKETVADAVYLINYLFKGGPKPCQNCP